MSHRSILQEVRSEERVNGRLIGDLIVDSHNNAQAVEKRTKSVSDLTDLVKSLTAKIWLNNQHIEALQEQFKHAFSTLGYICEFVRSIDRSSDNVSDEIRCFREVIDILTTNLPYVVATQVHRGIRLSQTNETLLRDRRQYCDLIPVQATIIRELYRGNLDPLLEHNLDSRHN